MVARKHLLLSTMAVLALVVCGGSYAQPTMPELPTLPPGALPAVGLPALNQVQPPLPAPAEPSLHPSMAQSPSSSTVTPQLPSLAAPSGIPSTDAGLPSLPQNAQNQAPAQDSSSSVESGTAAAVPKQFSFGKSNLSILFLPEQIERMKTAIRTYESVNRDAKPATFVAPEVVIKKVEEKINEPDSYPVFYLASIAYEKPSDWSVWISGHKITSRKNETDISILGISRDSVTFLWKPDYGPAILRRKQDNVFAATAPVKNKLAASQTVSLDDQTGAVTFTLRPNQSFSLGYLSIFEGYVESPKLQPVVADSGSIDSGVMSSGIVPPPPFASPSQMPPSQMPPGIQN